MARSIADDIHDLAEISRSLLDGDNIPNFRKAKDGFCFDISTRPPGHVVDDDGNIFSFGNRFEVLVIPLLRRLVVIRTHRQHAVGAQLLCPFRRMNRFRCRIASGSDDNRHSSPRLFDDDLNDAIRFIRVECRTFTGGATRQQHVDAAIDLEIDEPP